MQVAEIDGLALHYAAAGEGPALVFSNSLGTDLRVWDPLLAHLPQGLRVIRYDKRGHGLTDCPAGGWSMEDLVGDLAALLDLFGVSDAVVCGLSVGGLIAQGLAATRPDLVKALILCDTGAKIGTDEIWNQRIAAIEAGGMDAVADATLERWFSESFRRDPRLAAWRNMLVRTPAAGYCETARAIRDTDYREQTAALTLPCLAIGGSEDKATPPGLVRETAALIPGSRFELIEGAGRIPTAEAPDTLGRLIGDFLAELDHG